jgi:hypothetical protein
VRRSQRGKCWKDPLARDSAIRGPDAEPRLHHKSALPENPAQLHRCDVAIVHAGKLLGRSRQRIAYAGLYEGLHEHGIIGRPQKRPARNEQEALVIVCHLDSELLIATQQRIDTRSIQVCLVGEYLVEHVGARRRHAGTGSDEPPALKAWPPYPDPNAFAGEMANATSPAAASNAALLIFISSPRCSALLGLTCLLTGPRVAFRCRNRNTIPAVGHAILTFSFGMLQS